MINIILNTPSVQCTENINPIKLITNIAINIKINIVQNVFIH